MPNKKYYKKHKKEIRQRAKEYYEKNPRKPIHTCIESGCNKKVWKKNSRCRFHAEKYKIYPSRKGKKNNQYKDGRSLKKYYCIDCDKEIGWWTFLHGSKRCRSCSQKNRLKDPKNHPMFGNPREDLQIMFKDKGNPMFGKHHTLETKKIWSEQRKGKGNGRYIDGRSENPYPLEFNESLKELIRNRDDRKCQICGCLEVECIRKLDVHHIDYDKKNINPDNLISLCISCHRKTDYNRENWTKLLAKVRKNKGGKNGKEESK